MGAKIPQLLELPYYLRIPLYCRSATFTAQIQQDCACACHVLCW